MASLLNMSGGSLLGKSDSYIDWLKSLGCICWLPLSEEGDLLDRISGKSLELTGNGSFVWDSNAGMYKITTANQDSLYVAFLDNGMNKQSFPTNSYTTSCTIQRVSTSGYFSGTVSPLSTNRDAKVSMNGLPAGTGNLANWGSGIHKCARTQYNSDYKDYEDGVLQYDQNVPQYAVSSWDLKGDGLCIGIVRENYNIYYSRQVYVKDIYIFNTILSLAQIRKIQGYE